MLHQLLLRSALHGLGLRRLALWTLMGGGARKKPGKTSAAHAPPKNIAMEFLKTCNAARCSTGAAA